jgi:hypothetical protein
MPEPLDQQATRGSRAETPTRPLDDQMRAVPGLARLVAEAETTWRARAAATGTADDSDMSKPGWRAFEDAFPTFYEFTNRPR